MNANKLLAASKKWLAAVISFFVLHGTEAQTLNKMDSTKIAARLIRYEIKPGFQTEFRKVISEYILYAGKMESNILSEAYYEQDKPSVLWLIERWQNKRELDRISNSSQFKAIQSVYTTGMQQPAETIYVQDLEPLSKQQWRTRSNKEDKPVTVMLFVDSRAGTENNFKELYHLAMPQFRSESGVINYQLSQFENDSTRFVTYEKFRSEAAFQYHLDFPPIKPVLDYLNTSIKKQPFQTGLHKLVAFAPFSYE